MFGKKDKDKIDLKKFAKNEHTPRLNDSWVALGVAAPLWILAAAWSCYASWQGYLSINFGWLSWILALISQAMTIIYVVPSFRNNLKLKALILLCILVPTGHIISFAGSSFYSYLSITAVTSSSQHTSEHMLLTRGKSILRFNTSGYAGFLNSVEGYYQAKVNSSENGADPTMDKKQGSRFRLYKNIAASIKEKKTLAFTDDLNVEKALKATTYDEFYRLLESVPQRYLHSGTTFDGIKAASNTIQNLLNDIPKLDFEATEAVPSATSGRIQVAKYIEKYPFQPLNHTTCPPPSGATKLALFRDMICKLNPFSWADDFNKQLGELVGLLIGLLVELLTVFFNIVLMSKVDAILKNKQFGDRTAIVNAAEEGLYELVSSLTCHSDHCVTLEPKYWATMLTEALHRIDDCVIKNWPLDSSVKLSPASTELKVDDVYKRIDMELLRTPSKRYAKNAFERAQSRLINSVLDTMQLNGEILIDEDGNPYACMSYLKSWLVPVLNETGLVGIKDRPINDESIPRVTPSVFVRSIAEIVNSTEDKTYKQ